MKTGLTDRARKQVSGVLAQLLADEHVLAASTRNAHWNVVGPDFHAMHLFFEAQYKELAETIDEIAERIRALDSVAPASLTELTKLARLPEHAGALQTSGKFIGWLLADHEALIVSLRDAAEVAEKAGDDPSNDFIIGLIEMHEKMAWMLRASKTRG